MQQIVLSEESQLVLARLRAIRAKLQEQGIGPVKKMWFRRAPGRQSITCACPVSSVVYNYHGLTTLVMTKGRMAREIAASELGVSMEFIWGLMEGNDHAARELNRQPDLNKINNQAYWQGVQVGIELSWS